MPQTETKPKVLIEVLSEELNHIKGRTVIKPEVAAGNDLKSVFDILHNAKLKALCFSGGGIRSATFGLGIVQALAKHKLLTRFDYLSTVSGGGYLGSWLSAWVRREQMAKFEAELKGNKTLPDIQDDKNLFEKYQTSQPDGIKRVQDLIGNYQLTEPLPNQAASPNEEPPELQYLRQFSNFMSPKVGIMSADTWTLVAIYLRNLFLNQTIFIPLISAVLLLPKLFFALTKAVDIIAEPFANLDILSIILLAVGVLSGSFAVGYILYQLPSNKKVRLKNHTHTRKTPKAKVKIAWDSESNVVRLSVLPMLVLAYISTVLWAWFNLAKLPSSPFTFTYLPTIYWMNFVIFGMVVGFIGSIGYFIFNYPNSAKKLSTSAWQIFLAVLCGGIKGCLMYLVVYNLTFPTTETQFLLYQTFAAPVFLIIFLAAATLFVGLSSKHIDDADREWLARYGAWILIICAAWIILHGLTLFGPIAVGKLIDILTKDKWDFIDYIKTSIVPIIVAISGFISLFGGFSAKSSATQKQTDKSVLSKFLSFAPPIAGFVFLGFIFVGLISGTDFLMNYISTFKPIADLNLSNPVYTVIWISILTAFGIFMAFFVNVNKFSLHSMYRDRLVRAYLGASKENRHGDHFTNFDDTDNFQLHRLKGQKPFHIVNATLNLLGSSNNLAWQNRKGESFTMSPLHCGSWHLGYRPTNEYAHDAKANECENIKYCNQSDKHCPVNADGTFACNPKLKGKSIKLGTAMAISGAAANPNMGYYSSPIVTFLLALFNVRMGWWLGNPGKIGDTQDLSWLKHRFLDLLKGKISRGNDLKGRKFYEKSCPTIAVFPLINETLGRTDENKRYINVTDGGHFENLGLYEPILRRCKFIVVSDGAEDANFNFGEISNAIEKCKVDLGVQIIFKDGFKLYSRETADDEANKIGRMRFAVADIIYPESNETGVLLYLRPTYYGNEPTDVVHYAKANPAFPHQTTADEQYDEHQFEAYRTLGYFIMNELLEKKDDNGLKVFFDSLKNS